MITTYLKPLFICRALLKTHHSSPQKYEEEELKMLLLFGYNAWHSSTLYCFLTIIRYLNIVFFPVLKKIQVSLPILQNKDVYENTNQHLAQHQQGPDIAFKGLVLNYTSILEVKVLSHEFQRI